MATDKAKKDKEKGNAAFKAGKYPAAIGHYTAAILADRDDVTFPLNRAAAYLKLGKYEDAERDCNTVLSLSAKNVKGYFRRGQAKAGLGHLIEAQRDLTEALRLEPDNKATKEELRKVAEHIEIEKRKKTSSRQINPTFDATLQPAPATKRRRVPITIVGPEETSVKESSGQTNPTKTPKQAEKSKSTAPPTETPRSLKPSPTIPESKPQPLASSHIHASTASTPSTPATPSISTASEPLSPPATPINVQKASSSSSSFTEAKQAREAKTSKVGGGIFRASGQSTIFPTRTESPAAVTRTPPSVEKEVVKARKDDVPSAIPASEAAEKSPVVVDGPPNVPNGSAKSSVNGSALAEAPATLFDLVRAWRSMLTSTERWKTLQTVPPTSMPSFCKTSLEPPLLDSMLEMFLVILSSLPTAEDTNKIREYMDNLAKVPRFATLVMFLSGKEKAVAKEVWKKLGVVEGKPPGAWSLLGSL